MISKNVLKIIQSRNGPERNQNFAYFVSFKAIFDLEARISLCLQPQKSSSPSNKCANSGSSCWAPLLGFLESYSIKNVGQWLGRESRALPWSRRQKCEIHYKFQGENHRSSGATFTGMKTTKLWKHCVSRGFWKCAIWGRTLKLVQNGPQKPFLTWNGKGVERNWASKHSGEVGSTQAFSLKMTPAKDHNSFCEILW